LSLPFSYWIDKLGFVTEGKLAAIFIKPSLGVSNWPVIYIINIFWHHSTPRHQQVFWHRCRGKRRLLQGEFHTHILYFVLSFTLLYFCLQHFIKNTQKNSFLIVAFICLLLVLLEWLLLRTPSCVILLELIIVILSALLLRHLLLLQIFMRLSLLY
jgi:hypothetical protein